MPSRQDARKLPNIVRRLVLLVATVLLPVLTLSAFMIVREALGERDRLLQQLQATTDAASQSIDIEVQRLQAIVETLRLAPMLRQRDLPGFYGFAKSATAEQPAVRIALYEPSGQTIFSTNVPFDERLPLSGQAEAVRQAARTRQAVVTNLFTTASTRTLSLSVMVPVIENGDVPLVLSVAFPPVYISQSFLHQLLPQGSIGVVVDGNHMVIARTAGEAEFVGHPASADFVIAIRDRDRGIVDAQSLEGLPIRGAFLKSRVTGWTASFEVQRAVLNAPLWHALWRFGGGAAVFIIAALFLAIYQGRRIARPMSALSRMAQLLGRGEPIPDQRLNLLEAEITADAIRCAAAELAERTAEREHVTELMRRDRDLLVYNAISSAAEHTLDLQLGLETCLKATLEAFGMPAGAIHLLEPSGESLTLHASHGYSREHVHAAETVQLGEGVAGTVAVRKMIVTFDPASYPTARLKPMAKQEGFQTFVGAPILAEQGMIGTLTLSAYVRREIPPDELRLLDAVGRQLGTFISQARLYQRALHEIAEREKALALLETARDNLESFSFAITHDLRAPLRAIEGFSRILMEDYGEKLDAEGERVIGVVRDSTRRMTRMIDAILTFSRVGIVAMKVEPVDMQAEVRTAIKDLAPVTARRRMDFKIGDLPPAQGDAAMLQQVWVNLLGNAVKYTERRDQAIIEIGANIGEGETVYFVRDNGVGFDMKYADKLFGTFQRLHGSEFAGTGIGLSIVKRIVTRHGGRVWADAEVEKGAAFYFSVYSEVSAAGIDGMSRGALDKAVPIAPRPQASEAGCVLGSSGAAS